MHCIDDKANGIIVNHDGDWSGDVRIAWYIAEERHDPGPTPPSLLECWCSGSDLLAGLFTPISESSHGVLVVPPIHVVTRAVALAVESYLRFKLERFVSVDLFIRRDKL